MPIQAFGNMEWTLESIHNKQTGQWKAPILSKKKIEEIKKISIINETPQKSPIKCAILDTGISDEHPYLKNAIDDSVDFTGEGIEDKTGHGTIVALEYVVEGGFNITNTIPSILNVKVMNQFRHSKDEWIANGIKWATDNGAKIINLSIGYSDESCHPDHTIICDAIKYASSKEVLITVSAEAKCPAECDDVISVGGIMLDGSNHPTNTEPKINTKGQDYWASTDDSIHKEGI